MEKIPFKEIIPGYYWRKYLKMEVPMITIVLVYRANNGEKELRVQSIGCSSDISLKVLESEDIEFYGPISLPNDLKQIVENNPYWDVLKNCLCK